jgi:hypothetical protein
MQSDFSPILFVNLLVCFLLARDPWIYGRGSLIAGFIQGKQVGIGFQLLDRQ